MTDYQFPHFGLWLPLGGKQIPKWRKKGRAAVGVFPGRPSLLALLLCFVYYLVLTSFYFDLVVS